MFFFYAVVCMVLHLAVLLQYRHVTDRQTDRHDNSIYCASIASCGNNWPIRIDGC